MGQNYATLTFYNASQEEIKCEQLPLDNHLNKIELFHRALFAVPAHAAFVVCSLTLTNYEREKHASANADDEKENEGKVKLSFYNWWNCNIKTELLTLKGGVYHIAMFEVPSGAQTVEIIIQISRDRWVEADTSKGASDADYDDSGDNKCADDGNR